MTQSSVSILDHCVDIASCTCVATETDCIGTSAREQLGAQAHNYLSTANALYDYIQSAAAISYCPAIEVKLFFL